MTYIRVLIFGLIILSGACFTPSKNTVKIEFNDRYPTLEMTSAELIFEQMVSQCI